MQAYKLQGKIAPSGELIISEAIDLPAGDVEIILLQKSTSTQKSAYSETSQLKSTQEKPEYNIDTLRELLKKGTPVSPDFDPDQAKWEYLKEKHNL
ncbi:MAG: hypothetical protein HC916_03415 [Coleofasciculaceae cyanobacterium SM2_1_6]|nr:hypothetical protein [Coleofasciculaceae cyanobacterium SM2_1_6]